MSQQPPADSTTPPAVPAAQATLEFLLRRMRQTSDFPALSESVVNIQRLASSELESVGSLTHELLKDVALTNKLLRMVNTAQYKRAGGGTISTVSRAVSLIGFAAVRNLALSAMLVEHMENKAHAIQLKEEFLRTLMAGTLAGELSGSAREAEEAFITAVFQHLGRLLTEFYLPEEAARIRQAVTPGEAGARHGEAVASQSVLGISFEELGIGVGRRWGLPENLLRQMRLPPEAPSSEPVRDSAERLRWLAAVSTEMADAMLYHDAQAAQKRIDALTQRYGRSLGYDTEGLTEALERSRSRLSEISGALQITLREDARARRLLAPSPDGAPPLQDESALSASRLGDLDGPGSAFAHAGPDAGPDSILTAGIQDITNTMVENFHLNEVLRMILETMYRALNFRRVLFCLREPRGSALRGRFGLGEGAQELAPLFHVPLQAGPQGVDLFTAVCLKGADTLIADASVPAIAARLPQWFTAQVRAPTFLLLPMHLKSAQQDRVIGLIYADRAEAGAIQLSDKQLSQLRTLRNQAVMAFRQVA